MHFDTISSPPARLVLAPHVRACLYACVVVPFILYASLRMSAQYVHLSAEGHTGGWSEQEFFLSRLAYSAFPFPPAVLSLLLMTETLQRSLSLLVRGVLLCVPRTWLLSTFVHAVTKKKKEDRNFTEARAQTVWNY